MTKFCRIISAFLTLSIFSPLAALFGSTADVTGLFKDNSKMSYCVSCSELSEKKNSTSVWRKGMVSGNGSQGVITSGSAYSDTMIYQNIHFILPNKNARTCPITFNELETVKQNITAGKDITDNASYDDVYTYHPGACIRISQKKHLSWNYVRFTDYETAEAGTRYTDKNGTWERRTFTSREDNVTITKITPSSTGKKVNITLSIDNISAFANYGKGNETDLKYKKLVGANSDYLAFIAHYPEYDGSELKKGGYATLCRVICEGGSKETVYGKAVPDKEYAGKDNPQISITDADNVYLVAYSQRTADMGSMEDFVSADDYPLIDSMNSFTTDVCNRYTADGKFSYDAALQKHCALHTPLFDAQTLTLDSGNSAKSNEALLLAQRGRNKLNSALAQRAFYSGRYAYLCCSGSSTSRLYGMWTGEWCSGWGSKYTMDANVNLQTSSMNSGNMPASYLGYTYFLLRQMPDWEENAYATHGFTDAIQAPVNTDGDKAVITETCYPYPFRYWNAGASWMIQPLYETLKCYGNVKIPLSDEFSLTDLCSVLSTTKTDLTAAEISAINARGYLNLESDILLPLLTKAANYWKQLLTPEYYTDSKGDTHYSKGKAKLLDNEYFTILPSYSPENNPANYPSPSVANTAIDIFACRDNLNMLIAVMKDVDKNADTAKWEKLLEKLPPYLCDETGALKEFCCNSFDENNEHRHLSHMYCAWPLNETQNNPLLATACKQAIANRTSENEASHALVHRALIAARLKDNDSLTSALLKLMNHRIHYSSLMTNHDYDQNSCYCTDFAIGYLGIINESLVYSDSGVIEILPALPDSGFESGSINGVKAKTRATVNALTWDTKAGKATVEITSDIAQTITVSCKPSDKQTSFTFKSGETKTFEFDF